MSQQLSGLFQILNFRTQTLLSHISCPANNLLSASKFFVKGFHYYRAILLYHPYKTLHPTPPNYLIISLTNYLIKFTFALCLNGYQIYFHQNKRQYNTDWMKKFFIVGLGNIGAEYVNTRHNIGFKILDYFAKKNNFHFKPSNWVPLQYKFKGRTFSF
jgi:hypothetical protein